MTLTIAGKSYEAKILDPSIVRLLGHDGACYDVVQGEHRITCTCPHFEYRLKNLDGNAECKHATAVRKAGLLSPVETDSICPF